MRARKASKKEKGTRVKRPALTVEKKRNQSQTPRRRGPTHIRSRWYTKEPFTNHKGDIVVGIDPGRCALVYAYRQDGRSFKLSGANFMPRAAILLGRRDKVSSKIP